ncbi:MAG: nitrite reductase [Hyphomicrobiales bacterium]|jgi:nitrite reductase (NADH) small subunit|nr:nitrite reductase [Hyphomicrobiales bacterium]
MTMHMSGWIEVGGVGDVPLRGSRVVRAPGGDIALFKSADGHIFALRDQCPHKMGPLSQGIVHGRSVTCPLHNWIIDLESGEAQGADHGCSNVIALRVEAGRILLDARALALEAA